MLPEVGEYAWVVLPVILKQLPSYYVIKNCVAQKLQAAAERKTG